MQLNLQIINAQFVCFRFTTTELSSQHSISNRLHSDTEKADHESAVSETSSDIVQVPIGMTRQLDTPKIVRPAKSQSPSRVRLQSDLADSGMRSILHPGCHCTLV